VLRNKEPEKQDKELIHLAIGIARGMMYLHGLRPAIVHRDLKPQVTNPCHDSEPASAH
jgi:serine/threonine protein kinase